MIEWFSHYPLKKLYETYYSGYQNTGRCELPNPLNVGFFEAVRDDNEIIRTRAECELGVGDYSKANLSKYDMQHISFSDGIRWPEKAEWLPKNFSQKQMIIENGKNPGLGVRSLHEKGITGKGVRIAILDGILPEHEEYKENIKSIEDVGDRKEIIQNGGCDPRHGPAVVSLAVGKNCGVAPDAEVYYFPYTNYMGIKEKQASFENVNKILERVLELNRTILKDNPISVICMSWKTTFQHLGKKINDEQKMRELVKKVKDSGVFVCTGSKEFDYPECDMYDHGIGRDLIKNPDTIESILPAYFTTDRISKSKENRLLVPMDDRTVASPETTTSYSHCVLGGWSFISPYIAGLYCLAKQIDFDITPQRFWKTMLNTSDRKYIDKLGGCVVQPVQMITSLEKQKIYSSKLSQINSYIKHTR